MGADHQRRVIGYFTGWRTGTDGTPAYLASDIPWDKVTHINYALRPRRLGHEPLAVADTAGRHLRGAGLVGGFRVRRRHDRLVQVPHLEVQVVDEGRGTGYYR
ncbi:hypothetical protein SXANM310S_04856 [Streptomyces xanthochromogenes]